MKDGGQWDARNTVGHAEPATGDSLSQWANELQRLLGRRQEAIARLEAAEHARLLAGTTAGTTAAEAAPGGDAARRERLGDEVGALQAELAQLTAQLEHVLAAILKAHPPTTRRRGEPVQARTSPYRQAP
jgi:hypothetical protein